MFSGIRAVLFDLDGTLVDSAPDLGAAADKLRTDRGLPSLPMSNYRPMVGAGARGMLGVAFGMTTEHPEYEAHRDEFFFNYQACLAEKTRPFDGVPEMIAALMTQNLSWGVVTNKASRFTDPLTQALPLFASASAIVSGDTTPRAKPHPEPLLEASRRLGIAPQNCLYVGDDERDIKAGLSAGMVTVAALYGYLGLDSDVSRWGAHAQIETAIALLPLLGIR